MYKENVKRQIERAVDRIRDVSSNTCSFMVFFNYFFLIVSSHQSITHFQKNNNPHLLQRPDLAGWLYELTNTSIPHRVFEDSSVSGPLTVNESGTDIDGIWENEAFRKNGLPPYCSICGEEKIVNLFIFLIIRIYCILHLSKC
jgi:hypothetical protein